MPFDSCPKGPFASGWFAKVGQFENVVFVPPQPIPSHAIHTRQFGLARILAEQVGTEFTLENR
ncbi:MAG TPA: hypothetical protein VHL10_01265, partial [Nitrososphaera sp.]|nr:hypothetical protein [Nitrososphaera sp.]